MGPLWYDLLQVILVKHDKDFSLDNCKKMFGVTSDKFLSFLFLSLKYFIYLCKLKNVRPHFEYFKKHLKSQKETEYYVAKKRGNSIFTLRNGSLICKHIYSGTS